MTMTRRTRSGKPYGFYAIAGTLCIISLGGLSLSMASSERQAETAIVEPVQSDLLIAVRGETAPAVAEIRRLDGVRAGQFQELVELRRELASLQQNLEAAAARSNADAAEIERLNRVRQNLFEDLVGARRQLAAAKLEAEANAASARNDDPPPPVQQTGALKQVQQATEKAHPFRKPLPTDTLVGSTRQSPVRAPRPRLIAAARQRSRTGLPAEARPTVPVFPSSLILQGGSDHPR
jgi:hypothetical protein